MGKCSEKKNYISAQTVGWFVLGTLVSCVIFNVVTYSINKYRLEDAVATLTREQIRQDAKIEALKMFIVENTKDKK